MTIWIGLSLFLLLCYVFLILIYFIGWLCIPESKRKGVSAEPITFSIIIPVRNEQAVIRTCLESIVMQDYPPAAFEIIILNDHSEDRTREVVESFIDQHPLFSIRMLHLHEEGHFKAKKDAVTLGVQRAKNNWILLTDADCTRGKDWLNALNEFIRNRQSKFIYAPVIFSASTMFECMQALEFSGLVGIGGAAIRLKNPNMCSAANLAFERSVFSEVDGYTGNKHLAAGDDEFLLHKVFKKHPSEVFFLKDKRAIVHTSANASIDQLLQQRRRWVSVSTHYENRAITAILVAAYLFNFSIVFNLIRGIWSPEYLQFGLFALLLKAFVEGIFLFSVLRFFSQTRLLLYLILAEPFHLLYVLIIGIWANTGTYQWKNRDLN